MQTERSLRFHWSASPDDCTRDTDTFLRMCHDAEAVGIESLHLPIATGLSDALNLVLTAGRETSHVGFRVGWDFEGVLRSLTGRELKEAWETLGPRLIVHMSFDAEKPSQNERFLSAGEFIANCRKLFEGSQAPQFDVEGNSSEAAFLAIKRADCLWRRPHKQNQVYADALPVLHFGKEVGLVCSVIARETREEALDVAQGRLSEDSIERFSNLAQWIAPELWTDFGPGSSREETILLGSFDDVARAIHGFKKSGISQFMVRDWPGQEEMIRFGERVLPLIRAIESGRVN